MHDGRSAISGGDRIQSFTITVTPSSEPVTSVRLSSLKLSSSTCTKQHNTTSDGIPSVVQGNDAVNLS